MGKHSNRLGTHVRLDAGRWCPPVYDGVLPDDGIHPVNYVLPQSQPRLYTKRTGVTHQTRKRHEPSACAAPSRLDQANVASLTKLMHPRAEPPCDLSRAPPASSDLSCALGSNARSAGDLAHISPPPPIITLSVPKPSENPWGRTSHIPLSSPHIPPSPPQLLYHALNPT